MLKFAKEAIVCNRRITHRKSKESWHFITEVILESFKGSMYYFSPRNKFKTSILTLQ